MLEAVHTTILIIISERHSKQPTWSSGSKQQRTQAGSLRNAASQVCAVQRCLKKKMALFKGGPFDVCLKNLWFLQRWVVSGSSDC